MFIDDTDTVEATDEEQAVVDPPEPAEETTDKDANKEEVVEEVETPEDQLFELGSISDAVVPPEDESATDKTTDDGEETVKTDTDEPIDEVDKAIYGMQKRIDKVTAQKGEINAENASLRAEIAELRKSVESIKKPDEGDKVYTQDQLDTAYEKAVEDGDTALMREIRKHERENIKRELRKELAPVQSQPSITPQQQREANQIERQFAKYADKTMTEIYPGSHTELDIMNPTSALRRMSMAKYHNDPKTYHTDGGMVQAVVDSYTEILNIRMGVKTKQKNAEEELLKKKTQKLQQKVSQGSSSAMAARKNTTPSKPKSQAERNKDYVAERKKKSL